MVKYLYILTFREFIASEGQQRGEEIVVGRIMHLPSPRNGHILIEEAMSVGLHDKGGLKLQMELGLTVS